MSGFVQGKYEHLLLLKRIILLYSSAMYVLYHNYLTLSCISLSCYIAGGKIINGQVRVLFESLGVLCELFHWLNDAASLCLLFNGREISDVQYLSPRPDVLSPLVVDCNLKKIFSC